MAVSGQTINLFSSAIDDIFSRGAHEARAEGQRLEAEQYGLASQFARQNMEFTRASTDIKTAQQQRDFFKTMGSQQAGVAFAGFSSSGSALDLLRESTQQGALTKGVIEQQGQIDIMGFEQQAKSFDLMAQAANLSAQASEDAADNALWTAGFKIAAGTATLFT